jgi:hypothetical protein
MREAESLTAQVDDERCLYRQIDGLEHFEWLPLSGHREVTQVEFMTDDRGKCQQPRDVRTESRNTLTDDFA